MDRLENLKNIIMYLMADEHVSHRIPSTLEERQRMMRALMNVWEPRPIAEDILMKQDVELQMQREDKGVVIVHDEGLTIWQGDITRLKVEAIVNAANAQALGCWAPLHNCIDNCIHSAAGIQLRKECADKMCPLCHPHCRPDYSRWCSHEGAGRAVGSVLPFLP